MSGDGRGGRRWDSKGGRRWSGWLYMVCSSISGLRHFSGWTTGHGARHVILQFNVKGNGTYVNAACVEMEFGWTELRGEPRSQGGLSGGRRGETALRLMLVASSRRRDKRAQCGGCGKVPREVHRSSWPCND